MLHSSFHSDQASLSSVYISSDDLDAAFQSTTRRAQLQEQQLRDLDATLAENLSNSRAIINHLSDLTDGLKDTRARAQSALDITVPQIMSAYQNDLFALNNLGQRLPEVGHQITEIRNVYDGGRLKAQDLMNSLEWLNTPVPLRLRTIIFTSQAPVSARVKALVRLLFAIVFLACAWITWITLRGAVRAHRQRLVWGERLMS